MSKKKRRKSKPQRGGSSESPDELPSFDPRQMERMMQQLGRLLQEQDFDSLEDANAFLQQFTGVGPGGLDAAVAESQTPLDRAQDLMYDAWEARGRRRIALARQALEISPDCADAYVLLAEEAARDATEAKELYRQGVEAGERALGPEAFQEYVGHFWGVLETRPYMRARLGLAIALWESGEREEAIGHATEMLRLNPGDNQGVRYVLLNWLLTMGDDKATARLLKEYEDDASAEWAYSRALLAFRRGGDSAPARAALRQALETNPHVPDYLLGRKDLPRRLPSYIGFGDESEAVGYVAGAWALWLETEGALAWLAGEANAPDE